jgi:heme a synthase
MNSSLHRWLGRLLWLSVVILYLTVLAGAVVRASGSGMGCPDWPLCFGRIIPPTDVSQIPPHYMAQFLAEGHGNLFHTWVEFLNRVLGGLSGLTILGSCVLAGILARAFPEQRRYYLRIMTSVLVGLFLFGFVAWLGKRVVDTVLAPDKITTHTFAGLLLLVMAIAARVWVATPEKSAIAGSLRRWFLPMLGLTVVQIFLGTQVREQAAHLEPGACCDGRLESSLAPWFRWHWVGAVSVLLASIGFTVALLRQQKAGSVSPGLRFWLWFPGISVALEYLAGVLLIRLHLPPLIQPVHLLLPTLALGCWLRLFLVTKRTL